mgnify:CR=1 FL=1
MTTPRPKPSPPPITSDPVTRFLGSDAAAGGPRALLGLGQRELTREVIDGALRERLATLDAHPGRRTPSADEVRMALFAAAAQLSGGPPRSVDPGRHHDGGAGPAGGDADAIADAGSHGGWIDAAVRAAVASSGGWNRRAVRRLAAIAVSRGVPASRIASLVTGAAQPAPAGPSPATGAIGRGRDASRAVPDPGGPAADATAAPSPTNRGPDGPSSPGVMRWWFLAGVLALLAISVGLVAALPDRGSVFGVTPGPDVAERNDPGAPGGAKQSEAEPAREGSIPSGGGGSGTGGSAGGDAIAAGDNAETGPGPGAPAPERDLRQPGALLAELEASVRGLEFGPEEAIDRFARAADALGAVWPVLDLDVRRDANASVVSFLYRVASDRGETEAVLDVLIGPARSDTARDTAPRPDALTRGVWASGMLARLSGERDLPAAVRRALDAASVEAGLESASTFESGALRAVQRLPAGLAGSGAGTAAWEAWAEALSAVVGDAPSVAQATVRGAAEAVLIEPPPTGNGSREAALAVLVRELDWREAATKRWVLKVLAAPRYSVEAVRALTTTMVRHSPAPGVGPTHRLERPAGERERRDLRGRLAALWDIEADRERVEVLTRLIELIEELSGPASADPVEALADAARAAHGSAAASLAWRGRESEALALLGRLEGTGEAALGSGARGRLDQVPNGAKGENAWARRYLANSNDIEARWDLLFELSRRAGGLGTIDAEVLVDAALTGSPARIRERARELAVDRADEPAVVNAMLESLPGAPRIPAVAELAASIAGAAPGSLPGADDPDFALETRRALVERLLELLAAEGRYAAVDPLARLLAEAYAVRTGASPDEIGRGPRAGSVDPASLAGLASRARGDWAAALRVAPGDRPEHLTAGRIAARRSGRSELARGMIQRFQVEQVALFETALATTYAERTGGADALDAIAARAAASRRDSSHVLGQVRAVEFGLLRVWVERLKGVAP